MEVPASYNGPILEEGKPITAEWCENLMEYFKD